MPEDNLPVDENVSENAYLTKEHKIIVIGASTGGFEALKTIVKDLPENFNASVFIVWHMSPDVRGILPQVLNRLNTIYSAYALDKEEIKPNRIYIAPPDHHLLIEKGSIRVTRGPKENRFRPAIDPLFRSAAYTYSNRVIGVILSGALDDGTAGLWSVKQYGGIAVVQDPNDAEVRSMPESALRQVEVNYSVAVAEMAALLVRLSQKKQDPKENVMKDKRTEAEIQIAKEDDALDSGVLEMGEPSNFACPECHGVLSKIIEGNITRFRCHTGHAYSIDTLMAAVSEKIEDSLYNALRGIDESIMLLNHIGDHFAEINHPGLAALYFIKAQEAKDRAALVRKTVLSNEQLSKERLLAQADGEEIDKNEAGS
jgi:two-component system chemotaxis response regulator CheB